MFFQDLIANTKMIVTQKYFCFEGRAGRKEFWMWVLAAFIVSFVLGVIPKVGNILSGLFSLAILLPSLGVTARRLHDLGKSGWMQLLCLIPVVGGLIVLILCIPEGDKESNAYGAPAADAAPAAPAEPEQK